MFEGVGKIATGETDIDGRMIHLGDTVERDDGFIGQVVFVNCAYRVDSHNGDFLQYNSSLLFQESGKKRYRIIKEKR
ncbi:MAG: hypothetical protein ACOYB1_18645 [Limnohabitans sp.]